MKPSTLFIALSLALNLILASAFGSAHNTIAAVRAEAAHMLAQRVAVLEVEKLIERARPSLDVATRRGIAEIIIDASQEYRIPHKIMAAVAYTESRFIHTATGDGNKSHGIFQLQEFWVKEIPFLRNKQDLYRVDLNIRGGAWVLRYMADRCGEEADVMLACYNAGENNRGAGRQYAAKVMGL